MIFHLLSQARRRAFTLVELLVVIGIILVIIGLAVPAMNSMKGATDVTKASYDVSGAIDTARTYAMANNTYTWLGFFEEDPTQSAGTAGTGQVVMSIIYSMDGTQIVDPNGASAASNRLDPSRYRQVGKLIKIPNLHLKTFTDGSGNGNTFDQRPVPGASPFPNNSARIGDSNPATAAPPAAALFPFQCPVGSGGASAGAQYTFTKMIQFNPRGESNVNITSPMQPIVEIGLQPAHGATVDTNNKNVAAVQVTGVAGNVQIYRR